MKKVLVLVLCLILVFLIACTNQQNGENSIDYEDSETYSSELHPLDIEFEVAMSAPEVRANIVAIREVMTLFGNKWAEEMEQYLELMQSELDEDVWGLVAESQAKWESFVESDIAVLNQAYLKAYSNATITLAYRANNHYDRFRNRALHLIMLYEYLTADPNRI